MLHAHHTPRSQDNRSPLTGAPCWRPFGRRRRMLFSQAWMFLWTREEGNVFMNFRRSTGEKGVVLFLLGQRGERAVTAGEYRIARQREDLFPVVAILIGEMGRAASHRAREDRIANYGERPAQAGDKERRHARRMAEGEQRLDRDCPDVEVGIFLERLGAREIDRFKFAGPDLAFGFLG